MNLDGKSTKDIGNLGEKAAGEYLKRHGFNIVDRNVTRKTGEIDLIVRMRDALHFVEVKSVLCQEFPDKNSTKDSYDPSVNLHPYKIQKVVRTAEWYVAEKDWEGEWQVDGVLVWLRARDGLARVEYLPQIHIL
jgi:putative endonuclease